MKKIKNVDLKYTHILSFEDRIKFIFAALFRTQIKFDFKKCEVEFSIGKKG